jgi:uncharacterized membrane protein YpjA
MTFERRSTAFDDTQDLLDYLYTIMGTNHGISEYMLMELHESLKGLYKSLVSLEDKYILLEANHEQLEEKYHELQKTTGQAVDA